MFWWIVGIIVALIVGFLLGLVAGAWGAYDFIMENHVKRQVHILRKPGPPPS